MIVESAKIIIMLGEKLIAKIESRSKKSSEPVELKQALLEIVSCLRAWGRCAEISNNLLERWISDPNNFSYEKI